LREGLVGQKKVDRGLPFKGEEKTTKGQKGERKKSQTGRRTSKLAISGDPQKVWSQKKGKPSFKEGEGRANLGEGGVN